MKPWSAVTTDDCIAYMDRDGGWVVFDIKGHCAACRKCLLSRGGGCPCGGPYNAKLERDISAFIPARVAA